jgi:hypothetical protein
MKWGTFRAEGRGATFAPVRRLIVGRLHGSSIMTDS